MAVESLHSHNFYHKAHLSNEPVLVEFYSPNCPYCRKFAPVLDEFENEYDAQVYAVNVDEEQELARYYNIGSVPTTVAMRQGAIVTKVLGMVDKDTILQMMQLAMP